MGIDTLLFFLVLAGLTFVAAWVVKKQSEHLGNIKGLPFTMSALETAIEEGFVSRRSHPDDKRLVILNYTPKAQYEREWNDVTRTCRGLIMRKRKIVARPFAKFFNLDEIPYDEIPTGPFIVSEKADGSLGIIYRAPDGLPAVATRGSFTSDQAVWATKFLRAQNLTLVEAALKDKVTLLVEIIYPENRIVIDYGEAQSLTLLALINNADGKDLRYSEWATKYWDGPFISRWNGMTMTEVEEKNKASKGTDHEGFVLLYEDGTRLKVKADEYVRLHRVVTGLTPRKIHDMLSSNISVDNWAEYVPDEFYEWMKGISEELQKQFSEIENEAFKILSKVPSAERKVQAEFVKKTKYPSLVFAMLDQKPYSDQIWRMVPPEGETAFRVDIDS